MIKEMEEGKEGENRILEKSRSEILELKQKIHLLKEEGEIMKQDLNQTKAEFEQNDQVKEDEIHRLNSELKDLKRKASDLSDTKSKALLERDEGIEKLSQLNQQLETYQQDLKQLQKDSEEQKRVAEQRVEVLSAQVNDLTALLSESKQLHQDTSAEAQRIQQAADQELSLKAKELESLRETLETSRIEHQNHLKISTDKISELEWQLKGASSKQDQLKAETEEIRRSLEQSESETTLQFSEQLAQKDSEITRIKSSLSSKEQHVVAVEARLEELEKELEQTRKEFGTLSETHAVMESDLRQESESLKARLEGSAKDEKNSNIDQDYVDSILQQHQIDLSTARSQIRSLESRIFEEESKSHEMLTRIEHLQDELRGAEEALKERKNSTAFSPSPVTSTTTTSTNHRSIPVRSVQDSSSSMRPATDTLFSKMIDQSKLSDQTKHNRIESLNLLRTRMENELGLLSLTPSSTHIDPTSHPDQVDHRHLISPRGEEDVEKLSLLRAHHKVIPSSKLGDDMVWCGDCVGDLFMI